MDGTMTVTYRQRVENGTEGRPHGRVGGADGRADAEDHRLRHPRRLALGRAREVRVGRPVEHRRQRDADGYDGGLGIYRGTWRRFGGLEFAPNAGLATREEQIIVGQRIYDELRLGPVGLRATSLHWPQWSM